MTLDITRFCQALAKGANAAVGGTAGRHRAEKSDHRHGRLLRSRRERPSSYSTTE
jgi:hypothetical protein